MEAPEDEDAFLVAASWNVHGFVGRDRRFDPARCFRVIETLAADVVALQEVHAPSSGAGAGPGLAERARRSGHRLILGATLRRRGAEFGNALLTRLPVQDLALHDLSVPGREPRGAIDAWLQYERARVRVIATHLGLRASERRAQIALLADRIRDSGHAAHPDRTVLVGDFNEWGWGRRRLGALVRCVGPLSSLPTFPSRRPILPLDRIAVAPAGTPIELGVVADPLARIASDHLPLRARIRVGPA